MNISQLSWLCLSAAGIAFLYLVLYFLIFRYARAELSRSGASWEDDAIQIYAEADSLEYYLRVAIAASSDDRVTIIVNIPKNNGRKNEMRETVRMMRRIHKNIFYRMM
jgi:hypothetical protein